MSVSKLDNNILAIKSVNPELSDNTIRKRLRTFRIQIIVEDNDPNTIDTSLILLNLLPRFFFKISLIGDSELLDSFPSSHKKLISLKKIKSSLTISLGRKKKLESENPVLYVGSCGWTAYISTSNPMNCPKEHINSIGALLAGALACGETFKRAFPELNGEIIDELVYDPLTQGTGNYPVIEPLIPDEIHFEDLTLVGLGGVGMGIVYCLNRLNRITGTLRLIDPEVTDKSNEQRYLYSFKEHRNAEKVKMALNVLNQAHPLLLDIKAHKMTYEQLTETFWSDMPLYLPLVVVTVDNEITRKNVQSSLPKTIFNGWTDTDNSSMSYGIGKHELTGPYECLACAYFPNSGPKNQYELYELITGLSVDEIKRREENNIPTTKEDIKAISEYSGANIDNLERFVDKPITELLHGPCGVFTTFTPDRHATAPMPHIPILLAIQLVTQLIIPYLEPSKEVKPIESAAIFYGLKKPLTNPFEKRLKDLRCFCSDPVYLDAYKKKWGIKKIK